MIKNIYLRQIKYNVNTTVMKKKIKIKLTPPTNYAQIIVEESEWYQTIGNKV